MSYAIPADEPDGVTPAVLSAMVHLALLAVLIFGLRWQTRHPDAVRANRLRPRSNRSLKSNHS